MSCWHPFQAVRNQLQRRTSLNPGPHKGITSFPAEVSGARQETAGLLKKTTGAQGAWTRKEETTFPLRQKKVDCPRARIPQHVRARHGRERAGCAQIGQAFFNSSTRKRERRCDMPVLRPRRPYGGSAFCALLVDARYGAITERHVSALQRRL